MKLHNLRILVIGSIWESNVGPCAYEYHPGASDRFDPVLGEAIELGIEEEHLNRELIAAWLKNHAGDFQSIDDFSVCHWHGGVIIPWEKEESTKLFDHAMGF